MQASRLEPAGAGNGVGEDGRLTRMDPFTLEMLEGKRSTQSIRSCTKLPDREITTSLEFFPTGHPTGHRWVKCLCTPPLLLLMAAERLTSVTRTSQASYHIKQTMPIGDNQQQDPSRQTHHQQAQKHAHSRTRITPKGAAAAPTGLPNYRKLDCVDLPVAR